MSLQPSLEDILGLEEGFIFVIVVCAIEVLADCDTFAFDKTGTLTAGELEVEGVVPFGGLDTSQAAALAASLRPSTADPSSANSGFPIFHCWPSARPATPSPT